MGKAAGAITRTESYFGDRSHPLIEALRRLDEQSTAGGSNVSYRRSFTQADLVAGVLSVTHNLNQDWTSVTVYDQTRAIILPTLVTSLNANQIDINLRTFIPIAGTWNLVVIG